MMKLILKYRNKIVSLGLLPIIATLICLHFFQNTIVLGIGFIVCLGLLLYGIVRLKDLNFFLLLGSIGIGSCFVLRLFTGYKFIPYGSITPILEQRVYSEHQTQLFIETPYRNNKMLEDILKACRPQTKLCVAANITCEGEYIKTKTVQEWKGHLPDLSKIPCIFLIYK
jgi:hypothetical protein